jgi:thiamine transport system permease protein
LRNRTDSTITYPFERVKLKKERLHTTTGDIITLLFPLFFLGLFFYYPLLSILKEGLTDIDGSLTLKKFFSIIKDPYYLKIILFTVEQALISTASSILLGLPGAYLLSNYEFRGKSIIRAVTTVPFVLPSIIVVLGFVIFFGNNGLLNRSLMSLFNLEEPPLKILYSMKAIILAHTFYNFPIAIRLISAVWSRINPNIEKVARSLGARGLKLFCRVTLPQILPGIFAGAALIFIFCFTSFAIILVLGGGPQFSTIEVEIYRLARVSIDLKGASTLAIWEAILTILFMYIYTKLQQRVSFAEKVQLRFERPPLLSILKSPYGPLVIIYLIFSFAIIVAPMLSAIHYSFLRRASHAARLSYTLKWYRMLITGVQDNAIAVSYLSVVKNSLFFGLITILFSLPIGTLIAYLTTRRKRIVGSLFESALMLPLGISSIILGLGYIRAYQNFPWAPAGKWYAIALAHTVIAYPFVIRSTSAVFRKINPQLINAAMSLGANRWHTFLRVEFPMIKSGIIAGATFAFAISIGEINATLMLYNPNYTTIPIAIYRLISAYNFFGACALGTVLIFICFLVFLIIDKMGFEVS